MEIIVTRDDNFPPKFNASQYNVTVAQDSMEVIMDLSLFAKDKDAPSFGNGEMVFYKLSEDGDSDGIFFLTLS